MSDDILITEKQAEILAGLKAIADKNKGIIADPRKSISSLYYGCGWEMTSRFLKRLLSRGALKQIEPGKSACLYTELEWKIVPTKKARQAHHKN